MSGPGVWKGFPWQLLWGGPATAMGRSVTGLYWKREAPAMVAPGLDALRPQNGWAGSRTEAVSGLRAAAVSLPLIWPGFGGSVGPPPLCTRVVPLTERVALRVHSTPTVMSACIHAHSPDNVCCGLQEGETEAKGEGPRGL